MKCIVFLTLLLSATLCCALIEKGDSFDFFIFVTEWDPSMTTQDLTVHGFWPQSNDGSYPSYCGGPNFNLSAISDLETTLNQMWPSYKGNNTEFWSYEWQKHGSCSGYQEHDFFSTVITLHSKYDVKSALQQAGITPGNSEITSDSVIQGLKNSIGYTTVLNCNGTSLAEVGVCINKDLSLKDCPNNMGDFWECPDKIHWWAN